MSKKTKNSGKGRPTAWMVLVLILVVTNAATFSYFMFFQDTVPAEDVPMGIADIAGGLGTNLIGETITLMGYYIIAAGNNLLVSDPLFYFNNSLDFSNYVVITGSVPESMYASLGGQVAVKGTLQVYDSSDGTHGIQYDSFFDITTEIPGRGSYIDQRFNPYLEFADIPHLLDPTAEKYAVLYSGGIRPDKAYSRYWNDIIYMYFILQMHGYQSDNIYVVYKDGVGEDTYTPVDYPATHTSLDTVFGILSDTMGLRDTLFFYTTNHGGGGGISVWDAMDPAGALTHAQALSFLGLTPAMLTHVSVGGWGSEVSGKT